MTKLIDTIDATLTEKDILAVVASTKHTSSLCLETTSNAIWRMKVSYNKAAEKSKRLLALSRQIVVDLKRKLIHHISKFNDRWI